MNARITRIALASAGDGGLTDWGRLRRMTDAEIDAAVATDPDSFVWNADEAPQKASVVRYELYQSESVWRWRLRAKDGEILAIGPDGFADRNAAMRAIRKMYYAMAELGTSVSS